MPVATGEPEKVGIVPGVLLPLTIGGVGVACCCPWWFRIRKPAKAVTPTIAIDRIAITTTSILFVFINLHQSLYKTDNRETL